MKINGDLKFRTLGSGELQNAIIERVAGGAGGGSLPTGVAGRIAYNTDSNTYWFHDGTQWNEFGGGGDITNIVNSGGYMNVDGTFDATAFNGFTNIDNSGSPFANLVDALQQLDAAITAAAGVDTLEELTDTTINSPQTGQLLYYKDGTDQWTQTDVTALSDGDILTWDNGTSSWKPSEKSNVAALPDLTDVADTVTSGAADGNILRYNSGAAAGSEWTSEDLGYITTSDGETYISLTGAGAINPRVDGNSIHMYIDTGAAATLVAAFTTTELDLTAPDGTTGAPIDLNAGAGTAGEGGAVTINAGQGTGGAGGDITIRSGQGDTGEGGDMLLSAGVGAGVEGGDLTLQGGASSSGFASLTLNGGFFGTNASGGSLIGTAGIGVGTQSGGNIQFSGGGASGPAGNVFLVGGSSTGGAGGDIILRTGDGTIDGHVEVSSVGSTSGDLRVYDADRSNYIGLTVGSVVNNDVGYALPTETPKGSATTYVLGIDTLTTGGAGSANQMQWTAVSNVGGNSFETWANSGGSGDASIVADATNDTATLETGTVALGGIDAAFNAATDTIALTLSNSGLSGAAAIVSTDTLWFNDIGTGINFRTFANMLLDLNIVNNISTNGIVVQTAADTYEGKAVAAATANGEEGIIVTNGDGTAGGNILVGLDINGLDAVGGSPLIAGTDVFAMYDGTENVKVTVTQLKSGLILDGIQLGDLADVDATSPTAGDVMYYSGSQWVIEQPGATSGVQGHDAGLDSIAGLTASNNDFIIATATDTYTTIASGTTGRDLLGDETVADAITTLGLDKDGASDIWVNTDGDTMSGDLNMCGGSPDSARILLSDGSAGTPSLTYCLDEDTGLYRVGANDLQIVTGGTDRLGLNATRILASVPYYGVDGTAGAPAFVSASDPNTGIYNIEGDVLGVSAGGVERLRVYGKDFDLIGSPALESAAGALSVENTANYEDLIGDPKEATTFLSPIDDFLPNARWVEQYFLQLSGGTMTGDLVMSGPTTDINLDGGKVINLATPTSPLDAANKQYVDSLSAGLIWIDPVYYIDFLRDDLDATGTLIIDYETPANSSASVATHETSDMAIITDGGTGTMRAVGSTGNIDDVSVAVGDVVRLQDDADNGNLDPTWENLGNIADVSKFPSQQTAGQTATSARWFTRVATGADLGGTFINEKELGSPDARDGLTVVLVDADPYGRVDLGSPIGADHYDAWWGQSPGFGIAEVTDVQTTAFASITDGSFFYISAGLGNHTLPSKVSASAHPGVLETRFYVWYDKTGSTADPDPYTLTGGDFDGQYGIKVDISGATTADDVATATNDAINAYRPCVLSAPLVFTSELATSDTVRITARHSGDLTDAADGGTATGFTISTATQGTKPQPTAGSSFFVNNPNSNNFGKQFTFAELSPAGSPFPGGEWREIGATASIVDGVGLSFSGNVLNVNLGAGIFEQPGDEVGIELWNAASGALILTTDGTTRSVASATRLHLLLSAAGGLDQNATGLFIKSGGVTNDMLENGTGITFSGDAGTPTATALGETVVFNGTNGVEVTVGTSGSPTQTDITVDLVNVPNSALANSTWDLTDGTNTETVDLGETVTTTHGIVSATNTLKFFRIENAAGDAYVTTATGVADTTGDILIQARDASSPGSITINAGDGSSVPNGGDVTINSGDSTFGTAGTISLDVGTGTGAVNPASLTVGDGSDAANITLSAANRSTSGGGSVDISSGHGGTADDAGNITLTGSDVTVGSGDAGNIVLVGGDSASGDDGHVHVYGSTAAQQTDLRIHYGTVGTPQDDTDYIGMQAPSTADATTYTLPVAPASDGEVLTSSIAGVMEWKTPSEVGRTRIEDLDDVVVNTSGSPIDEAGSILVASSGSPVQYQAQQIQYIYDSTLLGSPSASTTHTINHNLGQKYVNVTVYNSSDQQILPQSVTLNSANQITVTLNAAIDITVVIMGVPGVVAKDGS